MSWFKRRTGCDRHIGMISRIENDVMLFLEEDKNYNIITCTTEKPSIKTIFTCDTEYVKYCETKERYFAERTKYAANLDAVEVRIDKIVRRIYDNIPINVWLKININGSDYGIRRTKTSWGMTNYGSIIIPWDEVSDYDVSETTGRNIAIEIMYGKYCHIINTPIRFEA